MKCFSYEKGLFTGNKILKSKKFFLCIHQAAKNAIGFEHSDERFTKFTYLEYGHGIFYVFDNGKVHIMDERESGLLDLREYVNNHVVWEAIEDSKIISFNPWRKNENWTARLIRKDEKTILSNALYSCVVCLKGTCNVNNKNFIQYDYADLEQDIEYNINISENSDVGLFELW